jgi:hypothetical protein
MNHGFRRERREGSSVYDFSSLRLHSRIARLGLFSIIHGKDKKDNINSYLASLELCSVEIR